MKLPPFDPSSHLTLNAETADRRLPVTVLSATSALSSKPARPIPLSSAPPSSPSPLPSPPSPVWPHSASPHPAAVVAFKRFLTPRSQGRRLTTDPENGLPVHRVIIGGYGTITGKHGYSGAISQPTSAHPDGGDCCGTC